MAPRRTLCLALLVASAALLSCGGDDSDGVFDRDGYPFTFTYPDALAETADVTIAQQLGNAAEETVAIGVDENNAIIVQRFGLTVAVGERNLRLAKAELERLLGGVDPDVRLAEASIAGFPALTAEDIEVPSIPEAAATSPSSSTAPTSTSSTASRGRTTARRSTRRARR